MTDALVNEITGGNTRPDNIFNGGERFELDSCGLDTGEYTGGNDYIVDTKTAGERREIARVQDEADKCKSRNTLIIGVIAVILLSLVIYGACQNDSMTIKSKLSSKLLKSKPKSGSSAKSSSSAKSPKQKTD